MHPAGVGVAVSTPCVIAVCELGLRVSVGQNNKSGAAYLLPTLPRTPAAADLAPVSFHDVPAHESMPT